MNATPKSSLVIALVVVAALFLLFGIGAMTGTMMNAGWMGTGMMNGMMGDGWRSGISGMGGMSWMWIPTLLALALGALLGWAAFGKKV